LEKEEGVRRGRSVLAFAGTAGVLVAVWAAGAAGSTAATKFTCTVHLQQQTSLSNPVGYDLGFVKCPAPFGRGLYHDSFKYTFPTKTTAVANGPFQYYFDNGMVHGTYHLSGITSGSPLTFHGHVKFVGGTAAFKHVIGSATETCVSKDGGLHGTCTIKAKLTGV
jgi:hypothetical protein